MNIVFILVSSIAAFQPVFCGKFDDNPVAAPVYQGDKGGPNEVETLAQDAEAAEKARSSASGEMVVEPLQANGQQSTELESNYEAFNQIQHNFVVKLGFVRSKADFESICAEMETALDQKKIPAEQSKSIREMCYDDEYKMQLLAHLLKLSPGPKVKNPAEYTQFDIKTRRLINKFPA